MSLCSRCNKPVYFAERKTSLGQDWHRQCLTCEECGKVLSPGQHAEHKGIPYCHRPCYSILFGPHITGYGSSHLATSNFGQNEEVKRRDANYRAAGFDEEAILFKLHDYNSFYEGKNGQLNKKEANGRVIFEGLLRVHWGVRRRIRLKANDDVPVPTHWRKSMVTSNGTDRYNLPNDFGTLREYRRSPKSSNQDKANGNLKDENEMNENRVQLRRSASDRYHTISFAGNRKGTGLSRRYSINGHLYDQQTCVFAPPRGSVTSVRVTSDTLTPQVVSLLLEKFKVEEKPLDFNLFIVRKSGDIQPLSQGQYPLLERVCLGPDEEETKIYIMEKDCLNDTTQELSYFISLPDQMLQAFLESFDVEEAAEEAKIRQKYKKLKEVYQSKLDGMKNKSV